MKRGRASIMGGEPSFVRVLDMHGHRYGGYNDPFRSATLCRGVRPMSGSGDPAIDINPNGGSPWKIHFGK